MGWSNFCHSSAVRRDWQIALALVSAALRTNRELCETANAVFAFKSNGVRTRMGSIDDDDSDDMDG